MSYSVMSYKGYIGNIKQDQATEKYSGSIQGTENSYFGSDLSELKKNFRKAVDLLLLMEMKDKNGCINTN